MFSTEGNKYSSITGGLAIGNLKLYNVTMWPHSHQALLCIYPALESLEWQRYQWNHFVQIINGHYIYVLMALRKSTFAHDKKFLTFGSYL